MGIFNEQSFDHPFAKGIQGAPGIGFSLTADGNYDMTGKKLTNVGAPSANTDAATKKYVDDNSSGRPKTSLLTVDSNIDMNNNKIENLPAPSDNNDATTKKYVDETVAANKVNGSLYLKKYGTVALTGNLNVNNNKITTLATPTDNTDASTKKYVDDTVAANKVDESRIIKLDSSGKVASTIDMNNNRIISLPLPNGNNQPVTLVYSERAYLKRDGSNTMENNLNMNNKKIFNLTPPTNDTDAATKKYVDDNSSSAPDLSSYLKKDGSVAMTGDLNVDGHKITNLKTPTSDSDATTKKYIDSLVHHTAVQPSHYKDQFAYLMSSSSQWTDEIDGGNSYNITKIDDLPPSKGNFHDYNHKVLYTDIYKNSQGGFKYKMGINFYRLTANADYTLCLEILNNDYQLWHKTQISVDKGTSTGLTIGNVSVRKLPHRYSDSKGQSQFMYYHRIIVSFKKLSCGNKFFLHILVNIPQAGTDLAVYPRVFSGVYIITYGIVGTTSNLDPDKVYDYHTAFDIKPTEVVYNVDINANNKKILNIALDKNNNNSAATVGMVKKLIPFTTNILYRSYFREFYDFTDANTYGLNIGASGVVFHSLNPNISFPNKDLSSIAKDGLNVNGYTITFSPSYSPVDTLCIVFYHWRNRNFTLTKYISTNNNILLKLNYNKTNNSVNLTVNKTTQSFTIPSSFNGRRIVVWLTEDFYSNVTKVKISNYSSTITIPAVQYNVNKRWKFFNEDDVLNKLMYSKNFYDFDSEQFHKIMLQEKLSGSYIV